MQSEFHLFTKLPTELRLMIWKCALRPISPTLPGVHFFSVPNNGEGDGVIKEFRASCGLDLDCETEHSFDYPLAAPKFGNRHSWTSSNPSAYLWDFGMWTACLESRELIEKHYKTEYWKAKIREDDHIDRWFYRAPVDTCVPFIAQRSDENWQFSIHPKRDLVCLQPLDATHDRFYTYYEYLNASCIVSRDMGLRGFSNLAFEYDSSWYDGFEKIRDASDLFEERSLRGLFVRTLVDVEDRGIYAAEKLWLIDYSLKRRKDDGDHGASKQTKVFNGIDRKFVQVDLDSCDYENTWSRSALQFLQDLDALFWENPKYTCLKNWVYYSDRTDEGCCGYCIDDSVQVLACEENV
ncbi:hypothetical protein V8C35DRAFT_324596 [Trichoderma chlorosporum]